MTYEGEVKRSAPPCDHFSMGLKRTTVVRRGQSNGLLDRSVRASQPRTGVPTVLHRPPSRTTPLPATSPVVAERVRSRHLDLGGTRPTHPGS
jgi:hypothetical protein